ncbi:MAG: hypothetical protein Q7S36_00180 [Candidatus Liptonbacteria bacterium]|nr:hypothetical protein [Candidatus Liptonbacteria bacterium]
MKKRLFLIVILAAFFASTSAFASFDPKTGLTKTEEFLFADMPAAEFAYHFIYPGQSQQETLGVIYSFYNPLWDRFSRQRVVGDSDIKQLLIWRSEGHLGSEDGQQSIGMLHVTFTGNVVTDVLYYSVHGQKTGKHFHKSAPGLAPNLNGD